MDALALDQMLPEYQEKRQDAEDEMKSPQRGRSPSPVLPSVAAESETIPVSDEPDSPVRVLEADSSAAVAVFNEGRGSKSSTSSSSSILESRSGPQSASFYTASSMSPMISYDRDHPAQKLVAVFGRQFDRPGEIANHFQKLVPNMSSQEAPEVKFVPFTMGRSSLMKGSYSSEELRNHNLVCMCYNASEARILLTGTDGFYSSLLRHVESTLGENCGYMYTCLPCVMRINGGGGGCVMREIEGEVYMRNGEGEVCIHTIGV
jgi:hypothetical protein